jgi:hypothetical protein
MERKLKDFSSEQELAVAIIENRPEICAEIASGEFSALSELVNDAAHLNDLQEGVPLGSTVSAICNKSPSR